MLRTISQMFDDVFKVLPLISQHGRVIRFLEGEHVGLERNFLFPNGDIYDRSASLDGHAGGVETVVKVSKVLNKVYNQTLELTLQAHQHNRIPHPVHLRHSVVYLSLPGHMS